MYSLQAISTIKAPLHVVTVVANPQRYLSRYKLYREFEKRVLDTGAKLTTVEVSFGSRPYEITKNANVTYIKLQTITELWHKEAMINIGISSLPSDWEYVAWIDADVSFARPDWVEETIHQLQHYDVVQMFATAKDLCPNYNVITDHRGFMWCYNNNVLSNNSYLSWHPGFAWATRRDVIDKLGGLIDWAVLGSADRHMACALIDKLDYSTPKNLKENCPRYFDMLLNWQQRAVQHVKKNVGFVDGTIFHYWHGNKADRRYSERWKILTDTKYDPDKDIKRDWQGLWQLTERSIDLRDRIRDYFRARNEDSIDVI